MVDGSMDAGLELMRQDVLMAFLHPFVQQACEEFPAALASVRAQLAVADGPIGLLGGSLGGAVALRILAGTEIPVFAGAVVNAAIRMRSVVDLFPGAYPYAPELPAVPGPVVEPDPADGRADAESLAHPEPAR